MADERRESRAGETAAGFVLLPPLWVRGFRHFTRAVLVQEQDGCWVCTSHRPGGAGYPRFRIGGQLYSLPRFVCLLFNGPGKSNECVMHTCDNRLCLNPAHLKMATIQENNIDMHQKGRGYRPTNPTPPPPQIGEQNNTAKLTERDVRLIRWAVRYMTQQEIADAYAIDRTNVGCIVRKETWKHVTE